MKISELLMTDFRIQNLVIEQSQNLESGECLFAIRIPFGFVLKKVRHKKRFRRLNWFLNPVYLTNLTLDGREQVVLMGQLIKTMQRD